MPAVFCLDCNHPVSLGSRPMEGQMITCSNCGAQLEVLSLDPLELDWAYLEPVVDDEEMEIGLAYQSQCGETI
jgi:lysine biosynthesis protein LysW